MPASGPGLDRRSIWTTLPPRLIHGAFYARFARAIRATEKRALCLDAMTDDPAATMGANGRKLMDRAFKAIEDMSVSSRNDLKAQVILIAAYFTTLHLVHLRVAISRSPTLVSRSTQ